MVAGCGFRPLYSERATGVNAQLAAVQIGVIDHRVGQILYNDLRDRFNPYGVPPDPLYRLDILVSEAKQSLGIRKDESATRANLAMVADFSLWRLGGGKALIKGTARSTSSYNILKSDFATFSAEGDARRRAVREISDDIKTQLATFLASLPAAPAVFGKR